MNQYPILDKVKTVLESSIDGKSNICLAVSGWADSMMMAIQVVSHFIYHNYDLHKIHIISIDHGVRPESIQEVAWVRLFFSQYPEIWFHTTKLQISNHRESSLRQKRRLYIRQIMNTVTASQVYTGHHLQDRIETVILNMCRGCDLTGMLSLSAQDKDIVRPLIHTYKEQIIQYCDQHQIPYWHDISNNDIDTSMRNRIRIQVIQPLIKIASDFNGTDILYRSVDQLFWYLWLYHQDHHKTFILQSIKLHRHDQYAWCYHCIDQDNIVTVSDVYMLLSQCGHQVNHRRHTLNNLLQFICHVHHGYKNIGWCKIVKSQGKLYILWWCNNAIMMLDKNANLQIDRIWIYQLSTVDVCITDIKRIGYKLRFCTKYDRIHHKSIRTYVSEHKIPSFLRSAIAVIVDTSDRVCHVCID